jgi:hypothetical protein
MPFVTQVFELGTFGVWAKAFDGTERKGIHHPAKIKKSSSARAACLKTFGPIAAS